MVPKKNGGNSDQLPAQFVKQFLDNQRTELSNQAQDIELKKISEKNQYDYACRALDAQKSDRKEHREQVKVFWRYLFWLIVIVLFLFAAFIGFCIYTNNVQLVVSVLKYVAYIVPSAGGGYAFGVYRGKKSVSDNNITYSEQE